jgi:hypothetical protein
VHLDCLHALHAAFAATHNKFSSGNKTHKLESEEDMRHVMQWCAMQYIRLLLSYI